MIELGLIGWPLGHSKSPEYFAAKFRESGIDGSYVLLPLEHIEDLPALIESHPNLRGFNVTIPYKESILPYLTRVSAEARVIGAVNTVAITRTGGKVVLTGHNTDCQGFTSSLATLLGNRHIASTQALILGTGGASKAVAYGLSTLGIGHKLVSRNAGGADRIGYEELTPDVMDSHRIIINCTPLGMWPDVDTVPAVPWNLLADNAICYDLVYNPVVTEFMKQGAARGAAVKNGLEMLHRQADAAWDIWRR